LFQEKKHMATPENEQRAQEFIRQANKKKNFCFGLLVTEEKYDEAAELFNKAANLYKIAQNWQVAAENFQQSAECHMKSNDTVDASNDFVNAGKCYKKGNLKDQTVSCYERSIKIELAAGHYDTVAKHYTELAELFEGEKMYEKAISYYTEAGESYRTQDNITWSTKMRNKVAECNAKLAKYDEARKIFEEIAKQMVENNNLRLNAKDYLFRAGLCLLCSQDIGGITETVHKYSEIDNFFDTSKEKKFLQLLQEALNDFDYDLVASTLANNIDLYNADTFKRELIKVIQDLVDKRGSSLT